MSRDMTKPTKWVRPAKTQISLGIRPVWSESSLSAWRCLWSLAIHWAHSEDSDQTGWMPRLIWVFAGRTLILLVLSGRGSNQKLEVQTVSQSQITAGPVKDCGRCSILQITAGPVKYCDHCSLLQITAGPVKYCGHCSLLQITAGPVKYCGHCSLLQITAGPVKYCGHCSLLQITAGPVKYCGHCSLLQITAGPVKYCVHCSLLQVTAGPVKYCGHCSLLQITAGPVKYCGHCSLLHNRLSHVMRKYVFGYLRPVKIQTSLLSFRS